MAEIYFRKNGTTYHLDWRDKIFPCEARFGFYKNNASGTALSVPAMSTQGTKVFGGTYAGSRYYYDTSSPTIAFRKNGKTYYCSKALTTESGSYDIPAGTYSPSTFENLIKSFISNNGSRTVSNSFSVEVNGQTYNVPAGRAIYYTYQYSGAARFVCFNGSNRGSITFQNSDAFARYGVYCTYWSYSQMQGDMYYQYSIRVNTGIKFR